jgi:hypothetical protein
MTASARFRAKRIKVIPIRRLFAQNCMLETALPLLAEAGKKSKQAKDLRLTFVFNG